LIKELNFDQFLIESIQKNSRKPYIYPLKKKRKGKGKRREIMKTTLIVKVHESSTRILLALKDLKMEAIFFFKSEQKISS
jgi:hypothetical protein